MIQQTISARKMSLVILLASFKMGTHPREDYLWMPSPPWRNSVGAYIILGCVRTDDPADDFRSKMVEANVLTGLVGLLQDGDSYVQRSSVDAINSLAKFGRLIYRSGLCED
jgi:hypothetical protein